VVGLVRLIVAAYLDATVDSLVIPAVGVDHHDVGREDPAQRRPTAGFDGGTVDVTSGP